MDGHVVAPDHIRPEYGVKLLTSDVAPLLLLSPVCRQRRHFQLQFQPT